MKNSFYLLSALLSLGLFTSSCEKEEYHEDPGNSAPTAEAGPNQTILLPTNNVTLSGSASNTEGPIIQYEWTKIAGPAAYAISDSRSPLTKVTDLQEGTYAFQLKVVDEGGLSATDFVTIYVLSDSGDPCLGCWDYGAKVLHQPGNTGQRSASTR